MITEQEYKGCSLVAGSYHEDTPPEVRVFEDKTHIHTAKTFKLAKAWVDRKVMADKKFTRFETLVRKYHHSAPKLATVNSIAKNGRYFNLAYPNGERDSIRIENVRKHLFPVSKNNTAVLQAYQAIMNKADSLKQDAEGMLDKLELYEGDFYKKLEKMELEK